MVLNKTPTTTTLAAKLTIATADVGAAAFARMALRKAS